MKEDKISLSKIETKSSSLKILAEDLLSSLIGLSSSLEMLH